LAEVHVLVTGYIGPQGPGQKVGSTVSLILDGDIRVVVDPGLVENRARILDPMRELGVSAEQITDVVLSHHHPDHTVNVALFPDARIHDHWAIYKDDTWTDREAEGFAISPSITLIETPGHTGQDITTLVSGSSGVTAFTHLWWTAAGPVEDPYAVDADLLHRNRARVLEIADIIVPGHGPAFVPDAETPR
jgi:glyoxylase-like metal-dependent hydrolase (beta-lactamase superfamily II)